MHPLYPSLLVLPLTAEFPVGEIIGGVPTKVAQPLASTHYFFLFGKLKKLIFFLKHKCQLFSKLCIYTKDSLEKDYFRIFTGLI